MLDGLANGSYALHLSGPGGLTDLGGNPMVGNDSERRLRDPVPGRWARPRHLGQHDRRLHDRLAQPARIVPSRLGSSSPTSSRPASPSRAHPESGTAQASSSTEDDYVIQVLQNQNYSFTLSGDDLPAGAQVTCQRTRQVSRSAVVERRTGLFRPARRRDVYGHRGRMDCRPVGDRLLPVDHRSWSGNRTTLRRWWTARPPPCKSTSTASEPAAEVAHSLERLRPQRSRRERSRHEQSRHDRSRSGRLQSGGIRGVGTTPHRFRRGSVRDEPGPALVRERAGRPRDEPARRGRRKLAGPPAAAPVQVALGVPASPVFDQPRSEPGHLTQVIPSTARRSGDRCGRGPRPEIGRDAIGQSSDRQGRDRLREVSPPSSSVRFNCPPRHPRHRSICVVPGHESLAARDGSATLGARSFRGRPHPDPRCRDGRRRRRRPRRAEDLGLGCDGDAW